MSTDDDPIFKKLTERQLIDTILFSDDEDARSSALRELHRRVYQKNLKEGLSKEESASIANNVIRQFGSEAVKEARKYKHDYRYLDDRELADLAMYGTPEERAYAFIEQRNRAVQNAPAKKVGEYLKKRKKAKPDDVSEEVDRELTDAFSQLGDDEE